MTKTLPISIADLDNDVSDELIKCMYKHLWRNLVGAADLKSVGRNTV